MSTTTRPTTTNGSLPQPAPSSEKSYFESQRELLVYEISQSLEHVLQNINKLNRSLEEVIAVGNEFQPVEALWSQFENVMAREETEGQGEGAEGAGQEGDMEGRSEGSEEGEGRGK